MRKIKEMCCKWHNYNQDLRQVQYNVNKDRIFEDEEKLNLCIYILSTNGICDKLQNKFWRIVTTSVTPYKLID